MSENAAFVFAVDSSDDVKNGTGRIRRNGTVDRLPLLELATMLLRGQAPPFIGRYFKGPHNADPTQYQPRLENDLLHERRMRVLPFARQTGHVGGSSALGEGDAIQNVDAVIEAFGIANLSAHGGEYLLYLDTEPPGSGPRLSETYYSGWSRSVIEHSSSASDGQLVIRPAVYLNQNDDVSARHLKSAVDGGAACDSLCVARYFTVDAFSDHAPPSQFDRSRTDLSVQSLNPLIDLWQYVGDCYGPVDARGNPDGPLDGLMLNPRTDAAAFLRRLLPPPPPSP